eukprot:TRINITY_DN18766_c0_g1_i2.p1 TRINITY_DN18766_c0_g1~~TRINITY_DN18766_c0_g1_i2.p1  ORF type:complete len:682 (+),score=159.08 TRINITY_DN18766_c0_g1_i2:146-2191(+)
MRELALWTMPVLPWFALLFVSTLLPSGGALRLKRPGVARSGPAEQAGGEEVLSLTQLFAEEVREGLKAEAASSGGSQARWSAEREAARIVLHHQLYEVQVNLEIEAFDTEKGVSMVFAKDSHSMRLDPGYAPDDGFAFGSFSDTIEKTGWSQLTMSVSESPNIPNNAKIYAAGYAEGLMTSVRISEFYANTFRLLLRKGEVVRVLKDVIQKKLMYWREMTRLEQHLIAEEPDDPYWKQVRYVLVQLWGICDGYNFAARHFGVHSLALEDLILINLGGELPQLVEAYGGDAAESFLQTGLMRHRGQRQEQAAHEQAVPGNRSAEDPLDDAHWEKRVADSGRCTALVRLTESNGDILFGHTTWDDYSRMIRIFKYYTFNFRGAGTVAKQIGFSSYPGAVSSTDDYYVLDSGLAIMETSIEVLDTAVWGRMPRSPGIPTFAHVMAVNRLAKNAVDWSRLFTANADSTYYAAQWMVLDFNKFTVKQPLPPNAFWVVEVIPGLTHSEDKTANLMAEGYWGSFNRPFFEEIREVSGHAAAEKSHGALYSWDKNPRAEIFKKQAPITDTLFDMRGLMTRNLWPNAGVTPSGPGHEISARMDLSTTQPLPNGGIDAKITSACLVKKLGVQAESGPSHSVLGPFAWRAPDGREMFPGWPHQGLPNIFNFNFIEITPTGWHDLSSTPQSAC